MDYVIKLICELPETALTKQAIPGMPIAQPLASYIRIILEETTSQYIYYKNLYIALLCVQGREIHV